MGRSGKEGKRGGGEGTASTAIALPEIPSPSALPLYEIPGWSEDYGVVAGITGRGKEPGPGFDLGLWSGEPVAEVMSRWLAFRREMAEFPAMVLGNQVHGVEVAHLDSGRGWIHIEGTDGWITITPGILLTVTVADCVPVYLVAPGRGIALLHAGWRGTAGGILRAGLDRLIGVTGSPLRDILMHCGVGICGACYEVGSEVMLGCGVAAEGPGPWHLDLRQQLCGQARELGLTRMTTSTWCSAHHRDAFFSHRASRGGDGRMVAYLGILPRLPPA